MFTVGKAYTKKDIYGILNVPQHRRNGAWDTGYREYEGNIFIFANVGVPGRTGHDYNNYWDGELFFWEAKTTSNLSQPLIKRMLSPEHNQSNFLFTRTNDKEPFTFEGKVTARNFKDSTPVSIVWQLAENYYYPLEDPPPINSEVNPLFYEGAVKKITVNRFERNPVARRICIGHYGAYCQICGFDFYRTYGQVGKDFIHVHHIVPISQINKEYELNPIKDLIPICPNCHSMIHRRKEAMPIEELKQLLRKQLL